MKKILVTGAGAPGGPGIIKALQKAGYPLVAGDANPLASGRFLHPHFVQLPAACEDAFLPFLLDYCSREAIDVLFPLVTRELFPLAAAKERFAAQGTRVIVSDPGPLAIANDKGKLYRHLQAKGIPVPRFAVVQSVEALEAAAKELGYPGVPVCMKPTVSNGSRGVRILQEDMDEYELLFQQKPNHLYSTLPRISAILQGRDFPPLLVSDYLPGPEYTVDAIVREGLPRLILPRSRGKMNNGISVQGSFENHPEIIAYCEAILRSLPLSGPIGLQVKAAAGGGFRLLEINPRIQGTSVAALGLGINLPALAVQGAFEEVRVDTTKIPWGTSFVRYWEEVFYGRESYEL